MILFNSSIRQTKICCCSVTKSRLTLRHGLQHTRLPCPLHYLPEFAQTHISSTSRSKDFQPAHQELCLKGSLLQGLCLSASVVTVPGDRLRAGPPPGGAPGGFSVGLPPETLTAPRDPRGPQRPSRPRETLATSRDPRDPQRPS